MHKNPIGSGKIISRFLFPIFLFSFTSFRFSVRVNLRHILPHFLGINTVSRLSVFGVEKLKHTYAAKKMVQKFLSETQRHCVPPLSQLAEMRLQKSTFVFHVLRYRFYFLPRLSRDLNQIFFLTTKQTHSPTHRPAAAAAVTSAATVSYRPPDRRAAAQGVRD